MKIAIISSASRFGGTTGDCVQASKTAAALRDLGNEVLRCYLRENQVLDAEGSLLGEWQTVLHDFDIVHTIPPIPWKFIKPLPKIRAKLVASTVFWRSWTYVCVSHRIQGRLSFSLIKEYVRCILAWVHIPSYWSYQGFDLLLPNSEDEIRNFKSFCLTKKNARMIAVPNAIDPIPEYVKELPRPPEAPAQDYIVVPAVFADRKNHYTLIEALKGSSYKVVFMGDGAYLNECKKRATDNMIFLGYVAHGSEFFYGLLKYARVCCLPSNCETPGIAGLEAAALGARPVVPYEGGTAQYYGWDAEYHHPLSAFSMRHAIDVAWQRGRLSEDKSSRYARLTWAKCAADTLSAYGEC